LKTKVVNLRNAKYDVYIGRAGHGKDGLFGNVHVCDGFCYVCGRYHDRDDCIAAFRDDFFKKLTEDAEFKNRVKELRGKTLGCFCKPKKCHGDVIAEYVDGLPDQ
jgi:hypothetical protein